MTLKPCDGMPVLRPGNRIPAGSALTSMKGATHTPRLLVVVIALVTIGCGSTPVRQADPLIERNATVYEAYVRAHLARYLGDSQEAVRNAEIALDASPDDRHLRLVLAQFLRSDGQLERAEAVLRAGLEPANEAALPIYLALGSVLEALDRTEEAGATLAVAVDLAPDSIEARMTYADFLGRSGDGQAAAAQLEAYVSRFPADAAGWRGLAQVERNNGRTAQALEAYYRVLALDSSQEDDYATAIVLARESGDHDATQELADECVLHFRRSVSCRVELVRSLSQYLDDAELRQQAIYGELQSLGRAIGANVGRLRQVERYLRRELDRDTALLFLRAAADDRPRNAQIQSMTAWAAYNAEQEDLAVEYMSAVLEVRPRDASALNFIGYSWAERGINLEEAERFVLAALEIRPNDANIQDSLGWVYFQAGRFDEAIEWLEEAVSRVPDSAILLDHLADAYRAAGRVEDALTYYRLALDLANEEELAGRIRLKIEELEADATST